LPDARAYRKARGTDKSSNGWHSLAVRCMPFAMTSDDGSKLDSGGRGREFPALPETTRKAILDTFNQNNPFFPGYLGFRVVDVRRGYSKLEVENRQELSNPTGIMHGGASFGLADTAVAVSLISLYGPGNALLTIEMKINYLEPIFPGLVTAEAF